MDKLKTEHNKKKKLFIKADNERTHRITKLLQSAIIKETNDDNMELNETVEIDNDEDIIIYI